MAVSPGALPHRAKCVPALDGSAPLLIDFISAGGNYDHASVNAALRSANEFFDQRDYRKALSFYAIAYDIFRLMAEDEIYLPLGHDILVRRVLCWSYLGELDRALDETTKALEVVPMTPSTLFLLGVVHAKRMDATSANAAF